MKAQIRDAVTEDKWLEAQEWEKAHWVNTQRLRARYFKNWIWRAMNICGLVDKYRGDDWNKWWSSQFNDYDFLPPVVDDAIEVGCGPYTNLRYVIKRCRPNHMFLSDPLIRTYIQFKLSFTADAYRRGFCVLDDHPLEHIPYRDNYFDVLLMINVLDHVKDAGKCMENATRILKQGGILVLGQDLTNEDDLKVLNEDPGLVGHPVKLPEEWFVPRLEPHFETVVKKLLPREMGREPANHYATLVFAGRKL